MTGKKIPLPVGNVNPCDGRQLATLTRLRALKQYRVVRSPLTTEFFFYFFLIQFLSFSVIHVIFSVLQYYSEFFWLFMTNFFLSFMHLTSTAWCWLTFSINDTHTLSRKSSDVGALIRPSIGEIPKHITGKK